MAEKTIPGPADTIEAIWQRWRSGDIARELAIAMATRPQVKAELSQAYVEQLCAWAAQLVWNDWEGAVVAQELTLAAVNATTPSHETLAMRRSAELEWLEIVTRAVCQVPDGRLFRKAVAVGEELAAQCGADGNTALQATVLHRLGVLHLDPYTGLRSSTDYLGQLRAWKARLHEHFGDNLLNVPAEELYLPEPVQGIERAASYLRRAADLRTGTGKALSLKALGQALEWRAVFNLPVDREAVVRCYREALELFDPAEWPNECVSIMAGLQRQGETFDTSYPSLLMAIPLPEYERRSSHVRAVDLGLQLLELVAKDDQRRALLYSKQIESLLCLRSDEQTRTRVYRKQVALIVATNPGEPGIDMLQRAQLSPQENAELQGLEWLVQSQSDNPRLHKQFAGATLWLRAMLHVGAGVNAFDEGNYTEAARQDSQALSDFMTLGFESESMDCIRRFGELITQDDPTCHLQLVSSLADFSIRAQVMLGEKATREILAACHNLMRQMAAKKSVDVSLVLMLFHIAKGLQFAAVATGGVHYNWRSDPDGLALLDAVAEAAGDVPSDPTAGDDSQLEDTMFLAAYIAPSEKGAGRKARDVLDNRQRTYDDHVNKRILEQAMVSLDLYPMPAALQSALDDRTVLVNYYLGQSPEGMMAVYILAITKDGPWMTAGYAKDFPSGKVKMSHGGREAIVSLFGMEIQALLKSIVRSPYGADVDSDAARMLERQADNYLGTMRQYLSAQREAGRDHLCVIPHGPLHFYPYHLLGPPHNPLAEEWIITYLPNLRLLNRPKEAASPMRGRREHSVASIGMSFRESGVYGQGQIVQATKEAEAIAKLFGVKPLIDDSATETAVFEALQSSRYVHIATHGELCMHAPVFHRIYVTPDEQSDGAINAYEILALDLAHLECLTLSACETSLGRFDQADDLRGLPASLFIAGVKTVIGTLWPVETNASKYFFIQFYKQIKKDVTRLDAFRHAQQETRKKYHKYRDWGAFYMAGDWR